MSASAGSDVVLTGVGSYHVTLAPSEGEYLDRRYVLQQFIHSIWSEPEYDSFDLNSNTVYILKGTTICCCQNKNKVPYKMNPKEKGNTYNIRSKCRLNTLPVSCGVSKIHAKINFK